LKGQIMKKILLAGVALAMLSGTAYAGSSVNATSGSQSGAISSSGSSASTTGGNQGQGQALIQNNYGAPERTIKYEGGYKLKNTPDAFAPPIGAVGGTCAIGVGVGASGSGFGVSIGSSYVSQSCEIRHYAVTLNNLGFKDAARNVMCQDERIRTAFEQANMPCPDKPSDSVETSSVYWHSSVNVAEVVEAERNDR
jgi:hypothetical protein